MERSINRELNLGEDESAASTIDDFSMALDKTGQTVPEKDGISYSMITHLNERESKGVWGCVRKG